ncbi:MAG: hypothetical protein WC284_14930 [Candidimonas sp.]
MINRVIQSYREDVLLLQSVLYETTISEKRILSDEIQRVSDNRGVRLEYQPDSFNPIWVHRRRYPHLIGNGIFYIRVDQIILVHLNGENLFEIILNGNLDIKHIWHSINGKFGHTTEISPIPQTDDEWLLWEMTNL